MAGRKRSKPPVVARRKRGDPRPAEVKEAAKRLLATPEWDPSRLVKQSAEERLRALQTAHRTSTTYDKADDCEACVAARADGKDPSALCAAHLSAALGF